MITTISTFNACINDVKGMRAFYIYLKDHYHIPENDLADLLRAELVNLVSAMDRFIHEIVRIGIVNSYLGTFPQTAKCKAIPFRFLTMSRIIDCRLLKTPPTCNEELAEYWVNKEVVEILKTLSFQRIDKIKDALSYVWDDPYKLQAIIRKMRYSAFPGPNINANQKFLEQKIYLIVSRRNQIVHEADYDITINSKQIISTSWLDDTILFITDFIYSIYEYITGDTSYVRL